MDSGRSTAWSGRVQRTFGSVEKTVDMADQATMLSQGEYDDSEEAETSKISVSQSNFRDVMTGMTLRLEQLLIKQDERRAKLFAGLFDDAVDSVVDSPKRPADVTEETVSSGVEISAQNSEPVARRKRREFDEPPQTACDSVVSIPVAVPEEESGTRQQRQRGEPLAKMADRLCDNAGHHYAVCCEHSEGHYRHGNVAHSTRFCAPSYGPRRTAVGIG